MPAAQLPATPPTDTMVKATREVKRQDLADTAGWMHLFICARRISAKSVDENDPEQPKVHDEKRPRAADYEYPNRAPRRRWS